MLDALAPGEIEERAAADALDPPLDAKIDRLIEIVRRGFYYTATAMGANIELDDIDPLGKQEPQDPTPNQQAALFRAAWR